MSEIGEAIGTVAEGGLYSRAVEKKDGEGNPIVSKGHFAEKACLNCGTALVGKHCHECGQKAHLHRTIRAFMHDVSHGALHFDSKTWRTLPKLLFKPGELTRRYIEGERARFVSPMALFLFSIFLMFAVFQLAGISAPTDFTTGNGPKLSEVAEEEAKDLAVKIDEIEVELADEDTSERRRGQLEAALASRRAELDGIRRAQAELPFLAGDGAKGASEENVVAGVPTKTREDGSTDIPIRAGSGSNFNINLGPGSFVGDAIEKWRKNPSLMLYKLQTNFYKFSWLLIPLSIPFVWLIFAWKRQFRAYDHAIFVTYSLGFMTLLTLSIVLGGLAGLPVPVIVFSSLLIPPIHMYKHLRGTYGLSRFSTLWRLALLLFFITVILTVFFQLLLLLGAF